MKPASRKKARKSFKVYKRKPVGAPAVSPEVLEQVTAVRKKMNVSLQDAASAIRRSISTLFQMEAGRVSMSPSEAEALLAFYASRGCEVVNEITAAFLP